MATVADGKVMELQGSGEGDACLGCNRKRDFYDDDVDKRAVRAMRKVTLLTAVSTVLCVLTLMATGSSVYLFYKINGLSSELKALSVQNVDSDYYYDAEYLSAEPDADFLTQDQNTQADETTREKRKKGNKRGCKGGKACKCCVRKVRSLIKSGAISFPAVTKTTTPKLNTPIPFRNGIEQRTVLAEDHYSSFLTNRWIGETFPPIDLNNLEGTVNNMTFAEWGGVLERSSKHFKLQKPSTINMLKEVPLRANATKLFDFHKNGTFVAKHRGIHLLYAHAQFYNISLNQSMAIIHERNGVEHNRLRCEEAVQPIYPDEYPIKSNNYIPCSVDSVLYVKEGDTLKMQSLLPNSILDLTNGKTYFGGILFSEIEKQNA